MSRTLLAVGHNSWNPIGAYTIDLLVAGDVSSGTVNAWNGRKSVLNFTTNGTKPTKTNDYVSFANCNPTSTTSTNAFTGDSKLAIIWRVRHAGTHTSAELWLELGTSFSANANTFGIGQSFSSADFKLDAGAFGTGGTFGYNETAAAGPQNEWHTVTQIIDTSNTRGCSDIRIDGVSQALSGGSTGCLVGNFTTAILCLGNRAAGGFPASMDVKAFMILHGADVTAQLANAEAYITTFGS